MLEATRRGFLAVALLGSTAACGFQPLYGELASKDIVPELASIRVERIEGRQGQLLRNELLDRLTPFGAPASPAYALSIRLDEQRNQLARRQDESPTRTNLTFFARFALTDTGADTSRFAGTARSITSFNISQSDFATLEAERAARRRMARELADDIATRIAAFLSSPTSE